MKARLAVKAILFILSFFMMENIALSQQADQKAAHKWVKSKVWANGIKPNVNPSVDAVEFQKQYTANKALWDAAFKFIKNHNLDTLAPGKYPIDGDNVYASVTEAPSRTFEQSGWESHRKYIDLQYVIKGQEKIGVVPLGNAKVTRPYDDAKESAGYEAEGTYYTATPKEFFLFFPNDVHRPNIKVDGYDVVKKLVIKIRVAQ